MSGRASSLPLRAWWLPAAIVAAIVLPSALFNTHSETRIEDDALRFHLPQINHFLRAPLDLVGFPAVAPTFPGYHVLMGWLARLFGVGEVTDATAIMRAVHAAFTIASIALAVPLAQRARRVTQPTATPLPGDAVAAMLPFAFSWYVAFTANYYGTEGLAHLCLVLALWAATAPKPRNAWLSAALAALVFVRHLFAPVLAVAALTQVRPASPLRSIFAPRNLVFAVLAVAPALSVAAIYIAEWKGLVPPGKASELNRGGIYPHQWLHGFAYLGIAAVLFLPLEWKSARSGLFAGARILLLAVPVALVLALWLLGPSDYSVEAGRWGSPIWTLGRYFPSIAGKALPVLAMSLVGAAFLGYVLARAWQLETLPVELFVMLAYLAGLGLSHASHMRYIEPVTLLCLGMFFHRIAADDRVRWSYAPLLVFSLASAAFSVLRLYILFRLSFIGIVT